jgi:glyceraldehyde 3-phosphate dehydrogenase (phosphorylating)
MPVKVAINGFGRIGRAFFRLAREQADFEVVAVADLADAKTLTHLLKYDSVHGRYPGTVAVDGGDLIVDDRRVRIVAGCRPQDCVWGDLGVWGVLEATGRFCRLADLAGHREAGAAKVVLSANPHLEDATQIPTFVLGVNESDYDPFNHHVVSNASCTTNCLAPVVQVLDRAFGVRGGLLTTIHAYTQDQNLLDAPHADLCRARAAALNMVPTTTGATAALGLVLPHLAGRFAGLSVRVPTPNVSLADLNVELDATIESGDINDLLRAEAANRLARIVEIVEDPVVSGDLNGCRASAAVDVARTLVVGGTGRLAKLLLWYDNETGYAARLVDLFGMMIQREEERGTDR